MTPPPRIREAKDEDAPGIIELVREVFAKYPGCVFDLDEMPDLRAFHSATRARGGRSWVAEVDLRVVGCIAIEPSTGPAKAQGGWEIHRLYVAPSEWGSALGHELMAHAEEAARLQGASFLELWSDTRFDRAHRFYERRGFVRGKETRELHDKSQSVELYFRRAS
jgi:putative acetyltransferase